MAKYVLSERELIRLQNARDELRSTNADIGAAIGKSESQASRLLSGTQKTIQLPELLKLLDFLRIPHDQFFTQLELPLEIDPAVMDLAHQSLLNQISNLDAEFLDCVQQTQLHTVIGLRVSTTDHSSKLVENTMRVTIRVADGKRILSVA